MCTFKNEPRQNSKESSEQKPEIKITRRKTKSKIRTAVQGRCSREVMKNVGVRWTRRTFIRDRWGHTVGAQHTGSRNVKERRIRNAKFEDLTASFLRTEVLWGTTFYCSVSSSRHFKQIFCLHHQVLRGHLTLDKKGTTLLQNVRNHSQ